MLFEYLNITYQMYNYHKYEHDRVKKQQFIYFVSMLFALGISVAFHSLHNGSVANLN